MHRKMLLFCFIAILFLFANRTCNNIKYKVNKPNLSVLPKYVINLYDIPKHRTKIYDVYFLKCENSTKADKLDDNKVSRIFLKILYTQIKCVLKYISRYTDVQTCKCEEVNDELIVEKENKEKQKGTDEAKVTKQNKAIENKKDKKPKSSEEMLKNNDVLRSAYMIEEKEPALTFMQKLKWIQRIITGKEKRLPPSEIAKKMLEEDKKDDSNTDRKDDSKVDEKKDDSKEDDSKADDSKADEKADDSKDDGKDDDSREDSKADEKADEKADDSKADEKKDDSVKDDGKDDDGKDDDSNKDTETLQKDVNPKP